MMGKLLRPCFLLASHALAQLSGWPSPNMYQPPMDNMYQAPMGMPQPMPSHNMPSQGMYQAPMDSMYQPPMDMYQAPMGTPQQVPSYSMPSQNTYQAPTEMAQPTQAGLAVAGQQMAPNNVPSQTPVVTGQALPAADASEVAHPDRIVEEQRRNIAQARQNLDAKIRELTEASEQQKRSATEQAQQQVRDYERSVNEQAQQQIRDYANRLDSQVQQTHSQVDARLKAEIEGQVRITEDYERRLDAQSQQAMQRYQEQKMQEAVGQAEKNYEQTMAQAKARLAEQMQALTQTQSR